MWASLVICTTGILYVNGLERAQLVNEVNSLKRIIIEKDRTIHQYKKDCEYLREEIQLREGEISYWGRLYEYMEQRDPETAKEAVKLNNNIYGNEISERED